MKCRYKNGIMIYDYYDIPETYEELKEDPNLPYWVKSLFKGGREDYFIEPPTDSDDTCVALLGQSKGRDCSPLFFKLNASDKLIFEPRYDGYTQSRIEPCCSELFSEKLEIIDYTEYLLERREKNREKGLSRKQLIILEIAERLIGRLEEELEDSHEGDVTFFDKDYLDETLKMGSGCDALLHGVEKYRISMKEIYKEVNNYFKSVGLHTKILINGEITISLKE